MHRKLTSKVASRDLIIRNVQSRITFHQVKGIEINDCEKWNDSIELRESILLEFATTPVAIAVGRIRRRCKHFRSEFATTCYSKSLVDSNINAELLEHSVLPPSRLDTKQHDGDSAKNYGDDFSDDVVRLLHQGRVSSSRVNLMLNATKLNSIIMGVR
jgi:hypothetical protein